MATHGREVHKPMGEDTQGNGRGAVIFRDRVGPKKIRTGLCKGNERSDIAFIGRGTGNQRGFRRHPNQRTTTMATKSNTAQTATPILVNVVGTELTVDVAQFTPEVTTYVLTYGLRQMLNDCHASITAKVEPDDTKRAEQKVATAEKKLASLMAGETQRVGGGGGGGLSPVEAEMRRMAEAQVKLAIKAKGGKFGDYDVKALSAALVARDEAKFRPEAERRVAEAKAAPAIELPSLEDLMA